MRDRLIELIKEGEDMTPCANKLKYVCKGIKCRDCERESIADHLLADGWIRLPCKVGDVVYRVCKKKYDVDGYGMQWEEDWGIISNTFHLGMLTEIGKTVFLTREDAEKALKERENDGQNK